MRPERRGTAAPRGGRNDCGCRPRSEARPPIAFPPKTRPCATFSTLGSGVAFQHLCRECDARGGDQAVPNLSCMSRPLRLDFAEGDPARHGPRQRPRACLSRRGRPHALGGNARADRRALAGSCLPGNRCRLLVEIPQPTLSRGMRQLNGVYATVVQQSARAGRPSLPGSLSRNLGRARRARPQTGRG